MGTYRQPAIIRNKAGLDAANQAVSSFNDSMSDFASKAKAAKDEKWCQQNPDDCAKINNSKKDKDDSSSSNSTKAVNPPVATNTKKSASLAIPPPSIKKQGGMQTVGTVQNFASDMEEDMYDNYNKNMFTTPVGSNKKNNYKSFYNGED